MLGFSGFGLFPYSLSRATWQTLKLGMRASRHRERYVDGVCRPSRVDGKSSENIGRRADSKALRGKGENGICRKPWGGVARIRRPRWAVAFRKMRSFAYSASSRRERGVKMCNTKSWTNATRMTGYDIFGHPTKWRFRAAVLEPSIWFRLTASACKTDVPEVVGV